MKKFLIFFVIVSILIGGGYIYYTLYNGIHSLPSFKENHTYETKYIIKKGGKVIDGADTVEEAVEKASQVKRSIAINTVNEEWVYSDLKPFLIITENAIHDFKDLLEAVNYAKSYNHTTIFFKNDTNVIWQNNTCLSKEPIDVPNINQYPELPRGCEVTSLAMILKYRGIEVDKMELASRIKRDESKYYKDKNGKVNYGNPYDGFVGDMYNILNNGYGVYHGPIAELASEYCDDKVIDITEIEFSDMLYFLSQDTPIWVITNATYKPLEDYEFEIWNTPTGRVKVTKRLHSVVMTGYDENSIFINDPRYGIKNLAVNRYEFQKAWEQMGNQAVIITE